MVETTNDLKLVFFQLSMLIFFVLLILVLIKINKVFQRFFDEKIKYYRNKIDSFKTN